jgi:hypothetical protein
MFAVRRLWAVGSVLTLIGLLATAHSWGGVGQRPKNPLDSTDVKRPNEVNVDPHAAAEMSLSQFADRPLVLYYRADQKETLFALQVKPALKTPPPLPRDYLLLLDTAAHMAGADWKSLRVLTEKFLDKMGADDRVALWTVNTRHHDLSKGFQRAKSTKEALKKLDTEYPAGAVNLRETLPEALKIFDGKKDRQRAIVFFGSGQSIAGPIDADLRTSLCQDMTANQIAFYSVPLGGHLDPYNLHGFANCTGGKVVRYGLGVTPDSWAAHLLEAVAQPILYDGEIKLPARMVEVLPSKLPPLRPDVPALVVGKFAGQTGKNEPALDYTLSGKVRGEAVRVALTEKMPAADEDNFFLVNMMEQWKEQKDRPALLPADRALAYASENNQLARADLVAQAEWALEKKKLDAAQRLYERALKADPTSARAHAGLNLVRDLRSGKKTFDQVQKATVAKKGDIVKYKKVEDKWGGKFVKLPAEQIFADPPKNDPPPLAPDQAEQNRMNDFRARQAIVDQEQTGIVNDAIRQANRLVLTRPDDAHDFLKRTLDGVRTNPDLSNAARAALSDRVERALQNVDIQGAVVRRDQDEALRLMANATARTTLSTQERMEQSNVRERMRVYHNLMNQAREQQAYRQAQSIRKDLIDQGLPVPPAVTAGYAVGLAGYHLREEQELRRIRQERWLAVLLEVERSHVPFPDEPPVEYPPAATWRALSEMRKARYESATFGADMPVRGLELQKELSKTVDFPGIDDARATLSDALEALSKRYNLNFDINEAAFKAENVPEVGKTEIAQTPILPVRTTLANVLRRILRRITTQTSATFLLRRDQIEITTAAFAGAEKTVRVYPVADLVMPIPNAVNTSMLMASSTLFGMSAGALGGFAGVGGLGGMGLRGMGLAGVGGVAGMGGNLGGLGGVGGIAGLGGQGFNQLGAGGGPNGGFQGNFQGAGNNGNGGIVGMGGQNLGQFGNLGGQFGLQGGNQSNLLINLIRQVVGKPGDWGPFIDYTTGQPVNPLNEENNPEGLNKEFNQLGFFPPAMALAVKGTSVIHTRPTNLLVAPPPQAAGWLPGVPDPKVRVAGNAKERPDQIDPNLDPRSIWQNALAKGVNNPGLIIATADFLVQRGKFEHAVEFLKANLRQAIVVQPWVYQSLALALRMAGGGAEDIERAEVSSADLEPKNANGYLQAAPALARDEKYGLALAFCRQAALVEPGLAKPYAEALNYAELARDAKSMQWAAGNLLGRDWPTENRKMHDLALQKIDALAKLLDGQNRKDEADRLRDSLAAKRVRDLVVQINWQGDADLDLHVLEPTGSECAPLHRQTINGGVLIGDSLSDMTNETYLAAQAFSGEYEIEIEKIWGHPLGNKAQLKIIRHQGTPQEYEQLLTVPLKSRFSDRVRVKLDDGRRTETAYVPPPPSRQTEDSEPTAALNQSKILAKLRNLADPDVVGVSRGLSAGFVSNGQTVLPSQLKSGKADTSVPKDDRTLYQTRVRPFVKNALDVTASAVLSADRRYVRLSMTPIFNTVTGVQNTPVLVNPTLPGGR